MARWLRLFTVGPLGASGWAGSALGLMRRSRCRSPFSSGRSRSDDNRSSMIRMSRVCALFACLVPLGLAAEVVAKQPEQEAGLRPIEPGVADVRPFGLSFRRLQRDMRQPTGFDRVYVLPPAAGAPGEP